MDGLLGVELLRIVHVKPSVPQHLSLPHDLFHEYTHLKKSQSSAAASISACQAFFPCPIIVAAMISYRYLVLIKSAALRKTAALSANGSDSHDGLAFKARSIASATSVVVPLWYLHTLLAWSDGSICLEGPVPSI